MPKQPVRWGLLSTARINDRLIPHMQALDRCRLVAVASRQQAKADAYAGERNIERAYGRYEDMLDDAEIDAVYISLPNGLHAEWVVRCADAGKHVLCEKPLALSVAQADQMIAAQKRNGVVIQEAAMMRFAHQTSYIRQLVADRAVGDIRLIRGVFTYVLKNPADVRLDPDQGGGSLWDLGSYCVSFARGVLGEEPTDVAAMQTYTDRDVEIDNAAQMRFAGGKIVQFYSSLASFAHVEADMLGTEGRIEMTCPWVNHEARDMHVRVIRHDGSPPHSAWDDGMNNQQVDTKTYKAANAYVCEVESMCDCILNGAPPVLPLSDSRANVAAIVALHNSARTAAAVRL